MQDLHITIIQTELHWEDIPANLEMFEKKLGNISVPTDLIVLPEMFNTGFSMNSEALAEEEGGKTIRWMKEKAAEKQAVIVGSLIVKEKGHFYNRLIWMQPDGTSEKYDKRHLFRMANEHLHFSPGHKRLICELKGWKICPMVCYDLRFPVWSRNRHTAYVELDSIEAEYDLLIYNANWPEPRSHAWKVLLQARAIENQVYVAGVNRIGRDGNEVSYSGDSVVIDPKGNYISKIEAHQAGDETVTLSLEELDAFREKFPVGLDADDFEVRI